MAFSNPPIKSIPGSAALGGLALKQVESLAKANQVMPSPDIMVSRTTGGTFLKLRGGAGGGGSGGGTGGGGGGGSTATGERVIYVGIVDEQIRTSTGSARSHILAQVWENGALIPPDLTVYLPEYLQEVHTLTGKSIKPTTQSPVAIMPSYGLHDDLFIVQDHDSINYNDLNVDARRWSIGITVCQNEYNTFFWIPAVTA